MTTNGTDLRHPGGRLQLFSSPTSPYARKVRVVAAEIGLDPLIDETNVNPFEPSAELLSANPLGKIPTLITESGQSLPDSSLIIAYLGSRTTSSLTPLSQGELRWTSLRMLTLAEGLIDAAFACVAEQKRPEAIIFTSFLDAKSALIQRTLDTLELDHQRLLSGDERPSVLEITLGCALEYLDLRMSWLEWRQRRPALASWLQKFSQRAAMIKTRPPR